MTGTTVLSVMSADRPLLKLSSVAECKRIWVFYFEVVGIIWVLSPMMEDRISLWRWEMSTAEFKYCEQDNL
ncbi:hypothetical protein TNIN_52161 [Trichonephila inaurata madagascariensis]|uniref:Uncharacterized protein n=1 Tax=Trichonephila inaurata madagascariensis TaxID=2747483 RepID=A0A8X6Y2W0_9ARAC|nr:hypothetical protein TNIN_52161 [Trichonephila inaurata madagascariensis]